MEHLKKIKAKDLNDPAIVAELGSVTIVCDIYESVKGIGHLHQGFVHRYNEVVEKVNNLIDYNNKHNGNTI